MRNEPTEEEEAWGGLLGPPIYMSLLSAEHLRPAGKVGVTVVDEFPGLEIAVVSIVRTTHLISLTFSCHPRRVSALSFWMGVFDRFWEAVWIPVRIYSGSLVS